MLWLLAPLGDTELGAPRMKPMTIIAATDGSALGNPGPSGWAWYIDENTWRAGALELSTNNVGELLAVLDLLRQTSDTGEDVHIFADSQYVINALTKWRFGWKKKGWKKADGKPVANREIMEALDAEMNRARGEGRRIEFEWVRGHNDHNLNEHADTHARAAATAIRDGKPVQQGPGFALKRPESNPATSATRHKAGQAMASQPGEISASNNTRGASTTYSQQDALF